ncbi:hypothetical protein DCCM_0217 [Desulfocucumis palustris]|uniref:Uncharacterized protein n=1 Tax=Desulfocucumis palustris TaxID=1898651 RepID=A0A2L2XCS8_9FIRM|nr:hypothetical protein DCCM_0217 [Desulfocucumis palustris]
MQTSYTITSTIIIIPYKIKNTIRKLYAFRLNNNLPFFMYLINLNYFSVESSVNVSDGILNHLHTVIKCQNVSTPENITKSAL